MRTRFYVEKRNDESGKLQTKDRPVFMSVSFSGNRVILGTGIKLDMQGWDAELQRVKSFYPDSHAINAWFESLIDTANSSINALKVIHTQPDSDQFREMFLKLKPEFSTGFFNVFYIFLEEKSGSWSAATYKKVRTIYKHLRDFETSTGYLVAFNNLNESFLEKFATYYADQGKSNTTTYKAINIIVWFLNWATERGFNVYRDYRKFYSLLGAEPEIMKSHIYLNWPEVLKIKEFKPSSRKMEWVRDLFCFMCFSGVRFSEMQRLLKVDIGNEQLIIRKRTGKHRMLPMNKFAREIYMAYENKYYLNNTAFPSMSVITMNKYLRIIGQKAGLDRKVKDPGGSENRIPLYEKLTAGMAVNTFVACALELQLSIEVISGFTGIQNDSKVRKIKMDLINKEMEKFDSR